MSPYNGLKVTGIVGSNVNFTWAFRSGNVDAVQWGTKRDGVLSIKDLLVDVDRLLTVTKTANSRYSGRVSGIWNGSSPGQVTFTLNQLQVADENFYACRLVPESLFEAFVYDIVQLLVLGKYPQIVFTPCFEYQFFTSRYLFQFLV